MNTKLEIISTTVLIKKNSFIKINGKNWSQISSSICVLGDKYSIYTIKDDLIKRIYKTIFEGNLDFYSLKLSITKDIFIKPMKKNNVIIGISSKSLYEK